MALFKKLKESMSQRLSQPESPLVGKGIRGRGVVLAARAGALREPIGGAPERTCTFTLEVHVEGSDPYRVETTKTVPETDYRSVAPGKTAYTVWVDPADQTNVEIDLDAEEPQDES
jgi:hypothetical protein